MRVTRAREPWSSYASPRNELRRYLISCHGAGEQSGPVPRFTRRTLPMHGLVYVSEGSGTYDEYRPLRRTVEVHGPAVIWLLPGVEHSYGPDTDGWAEHWILFSGESFAAFEGLGLAVRHRPVLSLASHIETDLLFGELRDALGTVGSRSEISASVATQRLLLSILSASSDDDRRDEAESLVDRLALDAVRPMTVSERALRLGVTVRELGDAVRAATGLTLNDFVIEVRIARSQALLAESRLDVGQIARSVGYGDAAYFSRVFARRVGMPPTVFRQQQSRSLID